MRESTYINNAIQRGFQRGELRAGRRLLLQAIQVRLQDPVPDSTRQAIESTNDLELLDKWYKVAITATTLADVLAVMNLQR